jgi:pyrroloquinoline quinone biosynthesis protein D
MTAPRLARKARLRWDSREQKYMILYPERGLLLNEAAHAVVALCDGRNDPTRIADILSWRFAHLDKGEVLHGVTSFLERLAALGLLEDADRPAS